MDCVRATNLPFPFVADQRDKILDFIYAEARRHRSKFLTADGRRVNVEAVSDAIGVHKSTLGRVVHGDTKRVSSRIIEGLMAWSGIESPTAFWDSVEHTSRRPSGAFLPEAKRRK